MVVVLMPLMGSVELWSIRVPTHQALGRTRSGSLVDRVVLIGSRMLSKIVHGHWLTFFIYKLN